MNRLLLFGLLFTSFIFTACSKEPYEDKIRKYFRDGAKLGIRLEHIKIDTVVGADRAKPFLEKRFERVKERITKSYEETYSRTKSDQAKQRLDSARQGLFSNREYDVVYYNDLLSGNYRYEQITVSYKLGMQGDIIDQVFVSRISERDTILQITDKDLAYYLTH